MQLVTDAKTPRAAPRHSRDALWPQRSLRTSRARCTSWTLRTDWTDWTDRTLRTGCTRWACCARRSRDRREHHVDVRGVGMNAEGRRQGQLRDVGAEAKGGEDGDRVAGADAVDRPAIRAARRRCACNAVEHHK